MASRLDITAEHLEPFDELLYRVTITDDDGQTQFVTHLDDMGWRIKEVVAGLVTS